MNGVLSAAIDTTALLSEIGMTVLIGISVVFAALIALTCVFWLFGAVARGKSTTESIKKPEPPIKKTPTPAPTPIVEDGVPDEVVAVIAAAIASMSDGNTQYAIRHIRPARSNARPVWAAAGIADNTQPF